MQEIHMPSQILKNWVREEVLNLNSIEKIWAKIDLNRILRCHFNCANFALLTLLRKSKISLAALKSEKRKLKIPLLFYKITHENKDFSVLTELKGIVFVDISLPVTLDPILGFFSAA